jgi:hypothetical protein
MPVTASAPVAPDEAVRKLRSAASILEGTIRNSAPPTKQRQAALKHVAAALQAAIDAVRGVGHAV